MVKEICFFGQNFLSYIFLVSLVIEKKLIMRGKIMCSLGLTSKQEMLDWRMSLVLMIIHDDVKKEAWPWVATLAT